MRSSRTPASERPHVCRGAGRVRERRRRVLDSPEWVTSLSEFQSYVTDLHSWVLGPGATGEQPLRPTPQPASDS